MKPLLLLSVIAMFGCGDAGAPKSGASRTGASGVAASAGSAATNDLAVEVPKVALSASPDINLVDNRYLWHLYRPGLLLPLAGEGMRKYSHEYKRPWTRNLRHQGVVGRALSARQSTLRFAWFDEPADATLHMQVHGLVAGQRVTVQLNGKSLGNSSLDPSWQRVSVPIAADLLRRGENEIKLHVGKAGTLPGGKSYGLWRALEITSAKQSSTLRADASGPLHPAQTIEVDGKPLPVLRGFERMVQLVEVPPGAWLDLSTMGGGTFRIGVTDRSGAHSSLLSHEGEAGTWQHHQISLAPFADQLIRLEFRGPAEGNWGNPRVALEAAKVAERPKPARNLILLVVDALRSDHVPLYSSVYGQESAVRMPSTVAEAAKGAVVFLNNQAASPSSPPSHGSIQTGMIPRVHGVDGDRGKLKAGTPMISTQAVSAGISAGYYGNNPFGMGRLEEPGNWTEFHQPGQEGKSNDCTTLVKMMLDFSVKQNAAGKRFFISSLPYETHTPYRYHKGISEHYFPGPWAPPLGQNVNGDVLSALASGSMTLNEEQWKQLKALYRGEGEYWDQCFGALVAGLEEAKLAEDTVLVLTSDHGEGMFEHGRMGHAFGHYRELGDVPFVVFWPALAEGVRNIDTVTSHRDIAPTVLDILGVKADAQIQGQSVLPLALRDGPWMPRVVSLEYGRSYSLRSRHYKLIADYNGLQEVYDLRSDPWEKRDIKSSGADSVRYLRDMAGFFLEYRVDWRYSNWGTLNRHGKGLLEAALARESAP